MISVASWVSGGSGRAEGQPAGRRLLDGLDDGGMGVAQNHRAP